MDVIVQRTFSTLPSRVVSSGGLAAVIYTDTLQTVIMIVGAIILTITGEPSLDPGAARSLILQ